MSTDEPFTLPKKKPNVLWWLAGVVLALLLVFFFQLFGPNPPIVVSRATTYITEPLGPDGLPNYEKYVLDMYRDGATPENNAAVLLLQALWPGELDPPQYASVAAEVGLSTIPSEFDALVPFAGKETRERVRTWLAKHYASAAPQTDGQSVVLNCLESEPNQDERAEKLIDEAMSRPWTSDQIPPLADWIAENKQPLQWIEKACQRPKLYWPSPSLIDNKSESLDSMLLPGAQAMREAARALSARAMWHLGEGQIDEAWHDVFAMHRLARLVEQGHTLVEKLVAMAIGGLAIDRTVTLLDYGNLTPDQARQIQRDLAGLSEFTNVADSLDHGERAFFLDAVIRLSRGNRDEMQANFESQYDWPWDYVSVDWNLVLRDGNSLYDRFATAARLIDWPTRQAAFSKLEAELRQLQVVAPTGVAAAAFSQRQRSEIMATIIKGMSLPALNAAGAAEDRINTQLALTRLAAALAEYRAEHGIYPETLDDLVPGIYSELPVDLFHAQPFIYKRDGNGYLLYSTGPNGQDDGGSNAIMSILKGTNANDLPPDESERERAKIPSGADDYSIRLPRPALEVQKADEQKK